MCERDRLSDERSSVSDELRDAADPGGGIVTVAWPAMAGPVTDGPSDAKGDRTAPKGESSMADDLSDGVWTSTSRRPSWRREGSLPATMWRLTVRTDSPSVTAACSMVSQVSAMADSFPVGCQASMPDVRF